MTHTRTELVYKFLAQAVGALKRCQTEPNHPWTTKWEDRIQQVQQDFLPSGAGWDSGTKIDLQASNEEKLVLHGSFHHMNEGGYYDGWTEHTITVHPSLIFGINLTVSGRNRNDIKEYIRQLFRDALETEMFWDDAHEMWSHRDHSLVDPFASVPAC